jgi:two-component system chemotaxis response regulator CheB
MNKRNIRVLIVDDSMLFRETLKKKLDNDFGIVVVDTAVDPYDARDKILKHEPDVMVLDVQMPRMDGIEFLKKLLPQYPIPVVVMSSIDTMVFDALKFGAVEFVNKPSVNSPTALDEMVKELVIKIKIASIANVKGIKKQTRLGEAEEKNDKGQRKRIIAIGASTGGTEALYAVLKKLPNTLPGIVVVQHMPPVFTAMYAERLNGVCSMVVKEAENGDEVKAGHVYIAPGGFQMRLQRRKNTTYIRVFKGEKRNGHCPSADELFDSVTELYGKHAVGIILTGMGQDGAYGILKMKESGAVTIGQDEKTSIVYGMPKVAYDIGGISYQMPLQDIASKLMQVL